MKKYTSTSKLLTLLIIPILFATPVSASTNAGIGPSSMFYFLDIAVEKVQLFFTWDTEKKLNQVLENANERLSEMKVSASAGDVESTKSLAKNYKQQIQLATKYAMSVENIADKKTALDKVATRAPIYKASLTESLENMPVEIQEVMIESISTNKNQEEEIAQEIAKIDKKTKSVQEQVASLKKGDILNTNDSKKEVVEVEAMVQKETDSEEQKAKAIAKKKAQTQANALAKEKARARANAIEKERLRKQVRELEAQKQAQELARVAEQKRALEALVQAEAQRKVEEEKKSTVKAQEQAKCLASHYSVAEVNKQEKKALKTLGDSSEKQKKNIIESYDLQIEEVKNEGKRKIEATRNAQTGFARNNALLNQIEDSTEYSVKDLENRKKELLLTIEATLSQQKLSVEMSSMEMMQNAGEHVCF